jgi:UTP:GlnB (protein PII) uridylyltransferase
MCPPPSSNVSRALTFSEQSPLSESELNLLNVQIRLHFSIEKCINRLTDKMEQESNPSESDVNQLLIFMRLYFAAEKRLMKTIAKFMLEGKL